MREELSLPHSIVAFENLNELLDTLDQSIEIHTKMIKRYEDRLGVLLRVARESNDPRLQSVSSQVSASSFGGESDPLSQNGTAGGNNNNNNGKKDDNNNNKKKKDDKKGREPGEEKGWVALQSEDHALKIATGSETLIAANEISLLFKIIETLKSKIPALEASRKLLSDLPSQGFKADRKLRIVFKDGLPKYVLPSTDPQNVQAKKFRYSEQFRIAVMK